MGVAQEDGRIESVLTADGEPTATIFAVSKYDADKLMKYWREHDLVILDVDSNRKFLRLQRDHSPEVRMKLRLLGCIWSAVQACGVPEGWRLEGTGTKGRLLAAKGDVTTGDKKIQSLVKILSVERSGQASVLTVQGSDEFLGYQPGTLDRLITEAIREADLRPKN